MSTTERRVTFPMITQSPGLKDDWLGADRQDSLKGFEVLQVKTIVIWAYMVMMDMEGGEQVQDTS